VRNDAYLVGGFAFVPHPVARGVWFRTHPCVAFVACDMCPSTTGVPCVNKRGDYLSGTHYGRRRRYRRSTTRAVETRVITIAEAPR
jgi:hypothetical protein